LSKDAFAKLLVMMLAAADSPHAARGLSRLRKPEDSKLLNAIAENLVSQHSIVGEHTYLG
jgi:hypothetical protein